MTEGQNCSTEKSGSCGSCSGFNYCFWAKLIVGIPAISLISIFVASLFHTATVQIAAGGVAAFIAMYLAVKIDQMKIFSGMVVKKKD